MTAALLAALLIGQGLSAHTIDAAQVDRVRKAVAETPVAQTVRADPPHPLWSDEPSVPPYARPGYPLYHYDFLERVTPEAFRASTLYPGYRGPEITPQLKDIFTRSGPELRRRQDASARKEVQRALATAARGGRID
jgi:hypothetical protein